MARWTRHRHPDIRRAGVIIEFIARAPDVCQCCSPGGTNPMHDDRGARSTPCSGCLCTAAALPPVPRCECGRSCVGGAWMAVQQSRKSRVAVPDPSCFPNHDPRAALVARVCVVLLLARRGFPGLWHAVARRNAPRRSIAARVEGVDIAVVGVMMKLPQSSARGTVSGIRVERIETQGNRPCSLSLAW